MMHAGEVVEALGGGPHYSLELAMVGMGGM